MVFEFYIFLANELSVNFYPEPYCSFIDKSPSVCFEESLLELWANNGDFDEDSENTISHLDKREIIEAFNTKNTSGIFLREKDFKIGLGGIKYNKSGHIVGARVATVVFLGHGNMTALKLTGSAQRGEMIDRNTYGFEGKMIEATTSRDDLNSEIETFVYIQRMLLESIEGQATKDIGLLVLGYLVVLLYLLMMMGKCNCVHQRMFLSIGGILGVTMGIIVSYGICSALGFFYSAAHTVMPFLLLGVGIDDMFVIVQCNDTLSDKEKSKSVGERIGSTMSQAGSAITVTSVTNFIAFGIGSTSSIPTLQSFCAFAAIGIFSIFIFQVRPILIILQLLMML